MKLKWAITSHDPLWTESQRGAWARLVERAAAGSPSFRDDIWLAEACRTLDLTTNDFQHDVEAARSGDLSNAPRLRGEWPDIRDLDVTELEISEEEAKEISVAGT